MRTADFDRIDDTANIAHLDIVDDILGRHNLLSTLQLLGKLAWLCDPVFGECLPTIDDYARADVYQKPVLDVRRSVHLHTVAYLAMVSIYRANQHARGEIHWRKLREAINNYIQYSPPVLPGGTDNTLNRFLIRTAYQQFPYQRVWYSGVRRAQFMFTSSYTNSGYTLPSAIMSLCRLNYDDLLRISFTIYLCLSQGRNAFFYPDRIIDDQFPWMTRDKLQAALKIMSQERADFKKLYDSSKNSDPQMRVYDFNPLLWKPLIKIRAAYYAPVPALIPLWATNGLSYHLSDAVRGGSEEGAFGDVFGHAFELFIGSLFEEADRDYYPERTITIRGQEVKTADFIVREGDRAVILDCKTRRFGLNGRYGSTTAIKKDLAEAIVKGVEQDIATAGFIQDRHPEMQDLFDIRHFTYAVVTMDDYFFADAPPMRELIQKELADVQFHFLSAYDLELLLANLGSESFVDFIQARCASSESYNGYTAPPGAENPPLDFALDILREMGQLKGAAPEYYDPEYYDEFHT